MRITEIRGRLLEGRMPAPIRNSVGVIAVRRALVVELVSESGVSGWGETQEDPEGAWWLIEKRLGAELADVDAEEEVGPVREPTTRTEALARSALDLARWDLRGRLLGASIAELLGGARRDAVPAYASGPFLAPEGAPYRRMESDAAEIVASGFRAIKLRIGVTPQRDVELLRRLRATLGDGVGIAVDANAGYGRDAAAALLRKTQGLGLVWIEEPIDAADHNGYRALAGLAETPLAAGETLWRLADAVALLATGAIGILQPDLYLCGGISGMRRLAVLAARHGVAVLPHVFGTGVNLLASLQFAAAMTEAPAPTGPTFPWLEVDRSANPLRQLPIEPALDADGRIPVPAGPGIGAAVDPTAFAPYLLRAARVALDARTPA
ncbi:MAG TPA: mandelate racemase/muconate lactonizing enzyme family protein [Gryllotalpicola sp.]